MKNRTVFYSIIMVAVVLINCSSTSSKQYKIITKEDAIKMAEQFIQDNGYTTLQPDRARISYELLDDNNIDTILKRRYNTLHPKAFCISVREGEFHVGFLRSFVKIEELDSLKKFSDLPGRAVVVNSNGTDIRIAHKDPLFSYFEKL